MSKQLLKQESGHFESPFICRTIIGLESEAESGFFFQESSFILRRRKTINIVLPCHTSNRPIIQAWPPDEKRAHYFLSERWDMRVSMEPWCTPCLAIRYTVSQADTSLIAWLHDKGKWGKMCHYLTGDWGKTYSPNYVSGCLLSIGTLYIFLNKNICLK